MLNFTKDDIFDKVDTIDFNGKTFVLTGTFTIGTRSNVKDIIIDRGGIVKGKNVTGQTNYIIVGEIVSDGWSHGNYGNKIEKALQLKKEKSFLNIQIIHEQNFIKCLEGKKTTNLKMLEECFMNEKENKKYPSSSIVYDYDENHNFNMIEDEDYSSKDPIQDIFKILSYSNVVHFYEYITFIKYLFSLLSKEDKEEYKAEIISKLHQFLLISINNTISAQIESANRLKTEKGKRQRLNKNYNDLCEYLSCYRTDDINKLLLKLK